LWRNVSENSNAWLTIKLRGTRSNRNGIGARVRIGNQHRFVSTATGYASSSYAGVHFGLGSHDVIPEVEVAWPSGQVQVLRNVRTRQVIEVREPAGS
jgi:enediyne biosynthesis protein E4